MISLFVFSCFLCVFFVFILYGIIKFVRNRLLVNKIPGPPSLPILGNTLDVATAPDKLWVYLRSVSTKYYPIFKLQMLHHTAIQIMHPEDIEKVISGMKHLQKSKMYQIFEPWLQTGLLTSSGSKWHYRRKILTPAFHFSTLQMFIRTFVYQAELLINRLEQECDEESTNVLPILAEFTLHSICESALGTRLNSKKKHHFSYVDAIHKMGKLIVHRVVRPWLHYRLTYFFTPQHKQNIHTVKYLHDFSMHVIKKRKEKFKFENKNVPTQKSTFKNLALLDLLLIAQRNGASIDDDGIREEVDTFMFEGHDTTLTALSFILLSLANHFDIQNKVVEELNAIFGNSNRPPTFQDTVDMNYLELVIKESLRMYPSVPFIARITETEFVTKDGYIIPPGTSLHVFIYDIHRNPELYPNPNKFDPYRFLPEESHNRHPFAYLPFSAGPRNCIGQKYAMMEMKVALSSILRNFILEPITTIDDLVFVTDIILRTRDPVKVKFRRRNL